MKFSLKDNEEKKLLSLFNQHEANLDYIFALIDLFKINKSPLDKKTQESLEGKSDYEKKEALFNKLGVIYANRSDFVKKNIRWETSVLNADYFKNNPYLKALSNFAFKEKGWTLSNEKREAYILCPYDEEYPYGANYSLKMAIGMFTKDYIYPSIKLYDTEWMSLNQHEIRTMETPIALAKGKVLTLGLGLGYYAYMVSNKEEVKEVHIVEMDLELINLFNKYLLPLFPHKEKIHIHKADAFYFIENIKDKDYDFIFSDIWHNVSDGVSSYLKLKKHFYSFKYTKCTYWIEDSILSYLRLLVIGVIKDEYYHNDNEYDDIQIFIKERLRDYEFKDSHDIDNLLCLKGMNNLFFN